MTTTGGYRLDDERYKATDECDGLKWCLPNSTIWNNILDSKPIYQLKFKSQRFYFWLFL